MQVVERQARDVALAPFCSLLPRAGEGGSSRANSRSPLHPSPTEWEKGWGVRAACRYRKGGMEASVSVFTISRRERIVAVAIVSCYFPVAIMND
jgi:hypothetical protein